MKNGRLCRQLFVAQRISGDHVAQRVKEQGFGIATVEPERHFFKVGGKMFCRDFMPRSDDASLEKRECDSMPFVVMSPST